MKGLIYKNRVVKKMRYFTIILALVLLISCKGYKNISKNNTQTDIKGKIAQIDQFDIKELNYSECSGIVIDQNDTLYIPFATIWLSNNLHEYKVNADKAGKFKIEKIKGGKYQIKVSFVGYCSLIDSINIENGKSTEYKIELKMAN